MMATQAKDSLASAMATAFGQFEAATKDATNPHFKSKYADLPAVIEAVKPALLANRLFFTQATHEMPGGVCVETQVHHESGESMSFGRLFVPANKQDAQGYGSALTYARRYSLMTAFGIPAEDDDGNAAVASRPANDRAPNGNGNGNGTARDDPFPPGPCKNKTELKTKGRELWAQVEGCGDSDEMEALLRDKGTVALISQLIKAMPEWWEGRSTGNAPFDGLERVIRRRRDEFAHQTQTQHPFAGG
jgi:hypothetical protein